MRALVPTSQDQVKFGFFLGVDLVDLTIPVTFQSSSIQKKTMDQVSSPAPSPSTPISTRIESDNFDSFTTAVSFSSAAQEDYYSTDLENLRISFRLEQVNSFRVYKGDANYGRLDDIHETIAEPAAEEEQKPVAAYDCKLRHKMFKRFSMAASIVRLRSR